MNITKRILIAANLFIGCSTQTSELTPVLQKHLTPDPAKMVESYVWDGEIMLNSKYYIGEDAGWLTTEELACADLIFGSKLGHVAIAPVIYKIPMKHIPEGILAPIILHSSITGKVVGDKIIVPSTQREQYDFKLDEDKNANLARVAMWRHNILSPALIARGFTGSHAQMVRFMANAGYFSFHIDDIAKLQKKDPNALTRDEIEDLVLWDYNINYVVHGKAKKTE